MFRARKPQEGTLARKAAEAAAALAEDSAGQDEVELVHMPLSSVSCCLAAKVVAVFLAVPGARAAGHSLLVASEAVLEFDWSAHQQVP
jgi:hypothetical protein